VPVLFAPLEAAILGRTYSFQVQSAGFAPANLRTAHRFPKSQYDKFDRAANRAAEQVCSPMSFDCAERGEDLFPHDLKIRLEHLRNLTPGFTSD
jgi:hypothetical protein